MQDVNLIVLCDHIECQYCYEGECGKDVLFATDPECIVTKKRDDDK